LFSHAVPWPQDAISRAENQPKTEAFTKRYKAEITLNIMTLPVQVAANIALHFDDAGDQESAGGTFDRGS
jgi:hypothetical protein